MEAADLKPLTVPEEEEKAAGVRVHEGPQVSSQPRTLEISPTKRQAYNRLLDKANPRISKAVKSVSVVKSVPKQSRVSSQPLTPSPSKGIRSSSSAPRINFLSGQGTQTAEKDADKATARVAAVTEALELLRGKESASIVTSAVELGKQTIESSGNAKLFDRFTEVFMSLELPMDSVLKGKLTGLAVSLADSKKQAASLREQMEACVSALSPHFFQLISTRSLPLPDSELIIHAFLMLLKLHDSGLDLPDSFKVMHHRSWKAFQKHASRPGKLLSTVKTLPQAVKHGKVTSTLLAPIQVSLQPVAMEKIAADEVAVTLLKYIQTTVEYAKSCELEREKEAGALQFMKLKDESPRRKLLTSLLNRSVEESREEDPHSFLDITKADRSLPELQHREELEEAKVIEVSPVSIVPVPETIMVQEEGKAQSEPVITPQKDPVPKKEVKKSPIRPNTKPRSRQGSMEITQKSPDIRGKRPAVKPKPEVKPKPKTAPRIRPVSKPETEPQPALETPEKLRLAMLFDIKMRVFLQDKVLTSKSLPEPNSPEDLRILLETFQKELESSREVINPADIAEYCSKQDQSTLSTLLTSIKSRVDPALSPNTSLSSWTHREIQRQKDRMSQTLTRFQLRKSLG